MYEGLHAGRKSHGFEIDHKQMDVLQHSLKSLNVAKHKDWSAGLNMEHLNTAITTQDCKQLSADLSILQVPPFTVDLSPQPILNQVILNRKNLPTSAFLIQVLLVTIARLN
jgi:hypothetical protein